MGKGGFGPLGFRVRFGVWGGLWVVFFFSSDTSIRFNYVYYILVVNVLPFDCVVLGVGQLECSPCHPCSFLTLRMSNRSQHRLYVVTIQETTVASTSQSRRAEGKAGPKTTVDRSY